MEIIDDPIAEQLRIESTLAPLDETGWAAPWLFAGWSICDIVLHLAQTQEAAAATLRHPVHERTRASDSQDVDAAVARAVKGEARTGRSPIGGGRRVTTPSPRSGRSIPTPRCSGWEAA